MRFLNSPGGLPECPYFHLWGIDFGKFALRLHRWFGSDDPRAYHDHRHWFFALVLWGGYTDLSLGTDGAQKKDRLRFGSTRFRRAEHRHTVTNVRPGTMTLLLTGPPSRRWSFYLSDGRAMKRDKYFAERGHHPCRDGDPPVRLKPDGSRIAGVDNSVGK